MRRRRRRPPATPSLPSTPASWRRRPGATYVARWTTAHPTQITRALKEAINHKGFSFIEILSQCPTQSGRLIWGSGDPVESFRIMKNMARHKDEG